MSTNADAKVDEPLARLRLAQRLAATAAVPTEACPPAERLWDLAQGDLSPDEAAAQIDHVAACPACAEALRVAVGLGLRPSAEASAAEGAAPASPRMGRGWLIGGVTLLAAGLAALIIGRPAPIVPAVPEPGAEIYRGPEGLVFLSESPATLPRDGFVLTWSPGPVGTVFDIRVLDSELRLLHEAFELSEPRGVVPASALAGHPDGSPLLWTVTAHLPDGQRLTLPTWTTRLASAEREAGG